MSHDVFISYSKKDMSMAEAVCHALEVAGVPCWMAPRDVHPGHDWRESIIEALQSCRVTVLILSHNASDSSDVRSEVGVAFDDDKVIVPFQIEPIEPKELHPGLRLSLASTHWLDASAPPVEQHMKWLVRAVARVLKVPAPPRLDTAPTVRTLPEIQAAAEQGHPEAQYDLGIMYRDGHGVAKHEGQALRWFRAAAEQGYAPAQYSLGSMNAYDHEVVEPVEARQLIRAAAEQGYAPAQFSVGLSISVNESDNEEGVRWLRAAAEQGYADAQRHLASCYEHGRGVAVDFREALLWLRAAGEQGHADAALNAGHFYEEGMGTARNYKEALRWFLASAEAEKDDQLRGYAHERVARMYEKGTGVAVDYREALRWYRAAAERRNGLAEHKAREIERKLRHG